MGGALRRRAGAPRRDTVSFVAEPERIGPYLVERLLGRGGMGAVYLARHPDLPRPVAVKLLTGISHDAVARFAREAQALARVEHPGVVRVHAFEQPGDGPPYLVTEYVEGEPLGRRAAGEGLPWQEACGLLAAVADAVAAAHARGVLHRDLKPDNVIVRPDGRPVLLDFGLARTADARSLTETGTLLGTPAYMAPEQAEGAKAASLDERTDVYGLGATLFAALCGAPPFRGEGVFATIAAVMNEPPPLARLEALGVPPAVVAAVRRALAKDPGARFPSAAAFAAALREAAGAASRPRRRVWPLAVVVAALGLAVGVAGLLLAGREGDPPPGARSRPPAAPEPVGQRAVVPEALRWLRERASGVSEGPERVRRVREALALLPTLTGSDRAWVERELRGFLSRPLWNTAHAADPLTEEPTLRFLDDRLLLSFVAGRAAAAPPRLLDVEAGPLPTELPGLMWDAAPLGGSPLRVAWTVEGRLAVATLPGTPPVWEERRVLLPGGPSEHGLAVLTASPEGERVLVRSGRALRVLRVADGEALATLGPLPDPAYSALFLDPDTVVVGTGQAADEAPELACWSLRDATAPRWSRRLAGTPHRMTPCGDGGAVGTGGGQVLLFGRGGVAASLVDARAWPTDVSRYGQDKALAVSVTALVASPDGAYLCATAGQHAREEEGLPEQGPPFAPVWEVARPDAPRHRIPIRRRSADALERTVVPGPAARSLALSPDGVLLAFGFSDGAIEVWLAPWRVPGW